MLKATIGIGKSELLVTRPRLSTSSRSEGRKENEGNLKRELLKKLDPFLSSLSRHYSSCICPSSEALLAKWSISESKSAKNSAKSPANARSPCRSRSTFIYFDLSRRFSFDSISLYSVFNLSLLSPALLTTSSKNASILSKICPLYAANCSCLLFETEIFCSHPLCRASIRSLIL